MKRISYFDFSNFGFASCSLHGFIELAPERNYEFAVVHQLPPELRNRGLEVKWLANPYLRHDLYRYDADDDSFLFCLDTVNLNGAQTVDGQNGFSELLLQKCRYYVKHNYNEQVIANHPVLSQYASKIIPLAISWPLATPQRWRFLPYLNPTGPSRWPLNRVRQRIRQLTKLPSLEDFRKHRQATRDVDVFFVSRHYSGRHHEEMNYERLAIVEELHRRPELDIVAGFAKSEQRELPGRFAKYSIPVMEFSDYLAQLARSRIGLYVRGNHGCLSSKFGQQMALGKAIVGQTILNDRENMYAYANFAQQFAYDDPRELVQRILDLVHDPQEIERLETGNIETFESHLVPKQVMATVLDQMGICQLD